MQNRAALAYQQTARKTASPRDLEADLLAGTASRLQHIRDNWDDNAPLLADALTRNRKLWSIFVAAVTKDDHPLPPAIRQNVANLGIFVLSQTLEVMQAPSPQKLDSLIRINRELAAGLRASAQPG